MNSRNWVRLFMSTLAVGGISAGIIGFIVKWSEYKELFSSFEFMDIVLAFIWFVGVGLIFSVISQMGFFAYLTIHRFGLGIFRSVKLWNAVQIVLIIFVLFDLIYFRYKLFADEGDSIFSYIVVALIIAVVGIVVALLKKQQTNKQAFVPAMFFMIVVTIIELIPAVQANDDSWLYLMLFPLLLCNMYQLLILPKLTNS
ncbi:KinB-signaling pathway activation protein [Cytobacillus sp. Hm23]